MITIPKSMYEAESQMRFFGAGSEKVHKKKFNIFIGISITNKKLTPEMALNYLKWAVRNTKSTVAVVIADELNIVNYEIFDKYSSGKAINRAKKVGDQFQKMFQDAKDKLSTSYQKKIRIIRWAQIKNNKPYQKVQEFLKDQYDKDPVFRSAVLYFVKKFMRKKGKVIEDGKKVDKLATYILGELPTLLQGIYLNSTHYNLCIYPTYFASGMSQFVMDIHAEELDIGKKLKNILKGKAILIEAWLD